MKIAFVSGVFFPQPGGAQVQTHNLANQLIENGKNVHCYVYTNPNIKIQKTSLDNNLDLMEFEEELEDEDDGTISNSECLQNYQKPSSSINYHL